ncbi:hypothetical protein E4H12_03895 [Candidatus Thorarchaeota archaeon]|nr:MAG: hypothetical protein E4H12_03895 [Candidatus Thorarchaeota archaeon]
MVLENESEQWGLTWVFLVLAAMHFIRCILILSDTAMSLPYINSNETYFLIPLLYLISIFMEMLAGFLFLTRRFGVAFLALLYVVTGIISPYPIFRTVQYLVFILPVIHIYAFIPTWLFISLIIGASNVIQIALLLRLGLNRVITKRVRDSSE